MNLLLVKNPTFKLNFLKGPSVEYSLNIGFSPNGEGENKILDPKGKNSCPSGEAPWARILAWGVKNFILAQAIGWESYSYELVIA